MHKVGKLEAYPTLVSASISAGSSGFGLNEDTQMSVRPSGG